MSAVREPLAADAVLPPWDQRDLQALLSLDEVAPQRLRTRLGDANLNLRAYGGQTLGQALAAASHGMARDRLPSMLQFLFLQGADPTRPIDLEVTPLQDGGRFSSRHVRGTQAGGRTVLDAQVSFARPLAGPAHSQPWTPGPWNAAPPQAGTSVPSDHLIAPAWVERMRALGGYSLERKPCLEFHVPDIAQQVAPDQAQPRLAFWLRARDRLPDEPFLHAAVFAYLSDWWLNFSSLGSHLRDLAPRERLYVSSLNHCIWFHRPFRPDAWMYFDCHSPTAGYGRSLAIARVHDAQGQLVASATQECLMAPVEAGQGAPTAVGA